MTVSGNIGEWVQVSTTTITPGIIVKQLHLVLPVIMQVAIITIFWRLSDYRVGLGTNSNRTMSSQRNGDCITGVTPTSTTFPGAEYQWYFNGIAIPGATSSTYLVPPGEEGLYQVVCNKRDCRGKWWMKWWSMKCIRCEATIENILCFNDNDTQFHSSCLLKTHHTRFCGLMVLPHLI